jgi:PAS domain S-box-containing protein
MNDGVNIDHIRQMEREKEVLLLRTLINHLPSSIFVLDNHYCKTIFNQAHLNRVRNTLGDYSNLTENDLIGKTNWEIYPKELADQYFLEDRRVIEEGETIIERENFQTDKNGLPVWETISKIPMRDTDGSIIGLVGIAHNITKDKLDEIALQQSEERYRFLFQKNPAPMLIYERISLKILAINDAFLIHYGYEKEKILNMLLVDLYPDNEKDTIRHYTEILEGYNNIGEWHHLKSNGEKITVVSSSNDIIYDNKIARVAVLIDISDRKLTEGKLKASEEKFRLISNSAHDGIFMLNDESRLIYWNPAVEKIFGYPGEELAFKEINSLINSANPDDQEFLPIDVLKFSTSYNDRGYSFELEMKRNDGENIQVELSLAPMMISDQWGAVGIIRDITERKKVENELILAKQRAEESDRLKSAFLATMSHELRTPLNAVIGFSSLIDETMEVPEILAMVKIINESGNHLLSIIDSVFSLALLQAGEAKALMEEIELSTFLNGLKPYLITKLAKENKERLKTILTVANFNSSIVFRSDKTKLTQLMINFFDNAIKYTQEGSIEYGCQVEDRSVTFFVKDTGIGIPENKMTVIFERFRQLEDSLTRAYSGVGLGLSICKEIADLLKGKIWVESKYGEGSSFYFKLEDVIIE